MNKIILLVLLAGGASLIAGALAFIIAYGEYEHHYVTKKEPLKIAFESGFSAFSVFFVLSLGVVFLFYKVIF